MTKEIASIRTSLPEVLLFGFGSFFRGLACTDVDVLVVFPDDSDASMRSYKMLRELVRSIAMRNQVVIDLTILTAAEFERAPLRDMDSLIPIK